MSEAISRVVVHHAGRLHVGVADGAAGEFEAAPFQFLSHRLRFRRACRNFGEAAPGVLSWLAINEAPDEGIETAELALHVEKLLRVGYCRMYLQAIAHDSRILQQRFYFTCVIAGNARRIEIIESGPVILAFAQDGYPAQPGLRAFENEKFKQGLIVVQWHPPFAVMIAAI